MSATPKFRCAIYTRKSTEDGLEQDFNSLDAQRESCEAFIVSQASLGWRLVKTRYDDGGISGGTLERPSLKNLLADIEIGKIDVIVVYKIDRLTRSLMDFSKLVEVFDGHDVSFVSVTQQFNTTTSMGRLTLNVLLSFAQFEREVTAERIRDKIAASKKRGMWMGGPVPLGYDAIEKKLVINASEAAIVGKIFGLYLKIGSVHSLKETLDELGIMTKQRVSPIGKIRGGKPFSRGNLYQLLTNPIYTGMITHHGDIYEGLHKAIIEKPIWQQTQEIFAKNASQRKVSGNSKSLHLLTGLAFDETGDRLSPTHANKKGVRYHYYISHRLTTARRKDGSGWRIPARQLDSVVVRSVRHLLNNTKKLLLVNGTETSSVAEQKSLIDRAKSCVKDIENTGATQQKQFLNQFIHRVTLAPDKLHIEIDRHKLRVFITEKPDDNPTENFGNQIYKISFSHKLQKRGVETKLIIADNLAPAIEPDQTLSRLIAKAYLWHHELSLGAFSSIAELTAHHNEDPSEVSRLLPFAFLAPDIVTAILQGTQPVNLTAKKLRLLKSLPHDWVAQRQILEFPSIQ